jgi:hypothetical protein
MVSGRSGFSHPKIEMSEGSQSSPGGAQFGTRYRDCMGRTDRPLCATNFQHFIIVYVRMEGYRCCVGTTPHSRRTYVRTNAKDKLRPFATNSAFCGGFEPGTVCYFPHHPTTWPHVTGGACTMYQLGVPRYKKRDEKSDSRAAKKGRECCEKYLI